MLRRFTLGTLIAWSLACATGPAPEADPVEDEAPEPSPKRGKARKPGRGGGGGGGGGAVTCEQVVAAWSPIYEAEFPSQGKVDRSRLTATSNQLGDIADNQSGARCWLSADDVMDCEAWGPNWLDDGIVYDGWSG